MAYAIPFMTEIIIRLPEARDEYSCNPQPEANSSGRFAQFAM